MFDKGRPGASQRSAPIHCLDWHAGHFRTQSLLSAGLRLLQRGVCEHFSKSFGNAPATMEAKHWHCIETHATLSILYRCAHSKQNLAVSPSQPTEGTATRSMRDLQLLQRAIGESVDSVRIGLQKTIIDWRCDVTTSGRYHERMS